MHHHDGHVNQFSQRDGAVRRLAFDQHRPALRVKAWGGSACGFQPLGQPLDAVRILGVDHRHRAVLACHIQHVENLAVVELHVVIGHIDLERGVALTNQARQFLSQHLGRRVADDQMERVVDVRLPLGAAMVVGHGGAQRLTLVLCGKRNHRSGAAASCRARAALKTIGHARWCFHRLVQVAVGVYATGRDDAASSVNLTRAGAQTQAELHDAAVLDGDVGRESVACRRHPGVANHQVKN